MRQLCDLFGTLGVPSVPALTLPLLWGNSGVILPFYRGRTQEERFRNVPQGTVRQEGGAGHRPRGPRFCSHFLVTLHLNHSPIASWGQVQATLCDSE